jgi:polyphosphate kinase
LVNEILANSLADNTKARELLPDGSYRRIKPRGEEPPIRSQQRFLDYALQASARRQTDAVLAPPIPLEPRPLLEQHQRKRQTG